VPVEIPVGSGPRSRRMAGKLGSASTHSIFLSSQILFVRKVLDYNCRVTQWPAIADIFFKFDFFSRPLKEYACKPLLAFDIEGTSFNSFKNSILSKLIGSCIMLKMFKSTMIFSKSNLLICLSNSLTEIEVFRKKIFNLQQVCQSSVIKSLEFRVGFQVAVSRSLLVPT
jgi:hypothetical protein